MTPRMTSSLISLLAHAEQLLVHADQVRRVYRSVCYRLVVDLLSPQLAYVSVSA
jgi:hypothetical protein